MEKVTFSCYGAPEIVGHLHRIRPESGIVAGMETHACVQQTSLDLVERGHTTLLVALCTGSRHAGDREAAIRRLERSNVILCTAENAPFEFHGSTGTDKFRAISRIVKPL